MIPVASDRIHDHWAQAGRVCRTSAEDSLSKSTGYLDFYQNELSALRERPLTIVEVGVFRGQFLETLGTYFPNSKIIGIEVNVSRVSFASKNVTLLQGDQGNVAGLKEIFHKHTPDGFDIIIDDASHIGSLTKSLYDVAIKWLKPGGRYYIEDWGTGYWPTWPDGAAPQPPHFEGKSESGFPHKLHSHNAGMVGFLKSLVDHVGSPETEGVVRLESMALWAGIAKLVRS